MLRDRSSAPSTRENSSPSSFVTGVDVIEEMTNAEVLTFVENETRINRQLFLENDLFERYLMRNEPPALANMEQMMQQAAQVEARQRRLSSVVATRLGSFSQVSVASNSSTNRQRTDSANNSISYATMPHEQMRLSVTPSMTRTFMAAREGPTINVSHKIDMVTRELEELRTSYDHLTRHYSIRKAHLKAQNEEISTMLGEIKVTTDLFIDDVIVKGVEPLTKKIPSRVFVRFMDEWFRKQDLLSGQLRLKTSTYLSLLTKLTRQLEEKMELGENLYPVDIDYQEIQMQEVSKILQKKNFDLALLKTLTANTNREFTAYKDRLAEQLAELRQITAKTADRERVIKVMEREADFVQKYVDAAESDLESILELRALYTVPDVKEYAYVKSQAHRIKKEIKTWNRRSCLQHRELKVTKAKLKNVKIALQME